MTTPNPVRRTISTAIMQAGVQACVPLETGRVLKLDVQAHRGGRGLRPENTLPAFEHALRLGVTTLELDIGLTADDIVVIAHDLRLNPDLTRDIQGRYINEPLPAIRSLTYAQLLRFDVGRIRAGSKYAQTFAAQVPQDQTPVPRLSDLFSLVRARGDRKIRFNIETKLRPDRPHETADPETMVRALLGVIDQADMRQRVSIQSFDWRTLKLVQRHAPDVPTVCLSMQQVSLNNVGGPDAALWTDGLRLSEKGSVPAMVRATGCKVWSPFYRELQAAGLLEARSLGLQVIPWTINEPRELAQFVDMGVDGIITDRPDLLLDLLRARQG